jgi:hypothetical protein
MQMKFVECTNGMNWGKFMLLRFTEEEWQYRSKVGGSPLLRARGWNTFHSWVCDLETGEGACFAFFPHAHAHSDLQKHRVWVCPLFEPFLEWLYKQKDPFDIPDVVHLPEAPGDFYGYRRPGPDPDRLPMPDLWKRPHVRRGATRWRSRRAKVTPQ